MTFEIDRVVELRAAHLVWPMGQLKQLLWTMLWGTVGAGMLILARRVEPSPQRRRGWARGIAPFPALIAAKFIICDTWWHAIGGTPAAVLPLANVQTLAAIVVIAVMAAYRSLHGASPEAGVASKVYRLAGALVVAVLLIVGWTEIGRVFSYLVASGAMAFSDAGLAKSVAISVFDALFAVAAVILGFRFHSTGLRYFGLGLFGLTLVKIFLIDLAHAGQGYRILSFIALGLLLLGTSVLYGKLSPKLLGEEA